MSKCCSPCKTMWTNVKPNITFLLSTEFNVLYWFAAKKGYEDTLWNISFFKPILAGGFKIDLMFQRTNQLKSIRLHQKRIIHSRHGVYALRTGKQTNISKLGLFFLMYWKHEIHVPNNLSVVINRGCSTTYALHSPPVAETRTSQQDHR